MDDQDRLAGFHRTISGQLNARLGESPKFFWALVVISVGYGYVLWTLKPHDVPQLSEKHVVFYLAGVLSYIAVLWANWYLAALGYAFRFLQNCQHCIEHALRWNRYVPVGYPRRPGEPPATGIHPLWLLPGIYVAHVFGLIGFLGIIVASFCWYWRYLWPSGWAIPIGITAFVVGVAVIFLTHERYFQKFRRTRRDPNEVPTL